MTDIQAIVEQMTLEEKAALCTGASAWATLPIQRLGVPEMVMTDGPHGVPGLFSSKVALRSRPTMNRRANGAKGAEAPWHSLLQRAWHL
jgi:hypothetical protein